jgi:hypothetical protein
MLPTGPHDSATVGLVLLILGAPLRSIAKFPRPLQQPLLSFDAIFRRRRWVGEANFPRSANLRAASFGAERPRFAPQTITRNIQR